MSEIFDFVAYTIKFKKFYRIGESDASRGFLKA